MKKTQKKKKERKVIDDAVQVRTGDLECVRLCNRIGVSLT